MVVIPPGQEEALELVHTAADAWLILEAGCTLEQLVDALADAYGSPSEEIAGDVRSFVDDLVDMGAIRCDD